MPAAVQPVPPEPLPGTPFRPVGFTGLQVTPYVKDGPRPRVAYSLLATGMTPVRPAVVPAASSGGSSSKPAA